MGRSLRLSTTERAPYHRYREALHKSIVKGRVPRHANTTGCGGGDDAPSCAHDLREYDSVQFVLRSHASWGDERWTEVVMLRWPGEASFVTASQERLRCGRAPHLRPCSLRDAAVRMMGPGCIRSMAKHPAVAGLYRRNNCSHKEFSLVSAAAERLGDREVERLRRAPDWQRATREAGGAGAGAPDLTDWR